MNRKLIPLKDTICRGWLFE